MTLYDFLISVLGSPSDPVTFSMLSFLVVFIVIDFIHTFYSAVFSMFKK